MSAAQIFDNMSAKAREQVEALRRTHDADVTDADVFVSPGGDVLMWVNPYTLFHVAETGVVTSYDIEQRTR